MITIRCGTHSFRDSSSGGPTATFVNYLPHIDKAFVFTAPPVEVDLIIHMVTVQVAYSKVMGMYMGL